MQCYAETQVIVDPARVIVNHDHLPNNDLDAITTGRPRDLVAVTLRHNLAAIDVAGDGAAGEEAVGCGTRAGASLPRCATAGDDVNGSECLVAEVTRWP